jgi:hypothetical protein
MMSDEEMAGKVEAVEGGPEYASNDTWHAARRGSTGIRQSCRSWISLCSPIKFPRSKQP